MKIYPLLMLQFILTLFGCKKEPAITTVSRAYGPFTIETITTSGKSWNVNYGRVNTSNVSYSVKFKGEPLSFGANLETNTGVPGIWRIFTLADASHPTLILGSQSLYLVTVVNESAVVKPLHEQSSDFASIQWLDSEEGQPGLYREIYSSDDIDTSQVVAGGRYMAISHAVVLDTRTLETFPFNINNNYVDGYSITGWSVIGFSPDSSQLLFRGSKNDEDNYELVHWALLSYNFRTGKTYAVPFDKVALRLVDESRITTEWISDYFEWQKLDDGSLQLVLKTQAIPMYQKGTLVFERNTGYTYVLKPVKETMTDHLLAYIRQELQLDTSQVNKKEGDYVDQFYITFDELTLVLTYGEYGDDLVLKQERGFDIGKSKPVMSRIGKGFNAILNTGKFVDDWKVYTAGVE